MEKIEKAANESNKMTISVAQKLLGDITTEKREQLLKSRKNKRPASKIDMLATIAVVKESQPEEQVSRFVISVDSKWKQMWDIWCMLLVLYVALVVPYRLSLDLDDNKGLVVFNIIMDLCFLLDIVLTFFTSYYDDNAGRTISTNREIAVKYLTSFFFYIDVISIFPFEPIINYA